MSNVLSQDEVDALLKGVQSGEIDTQTAKEKLTQGVRPYDLTSQERIVRGRMPGLEMANERFTRLFRNSVSNVLRKFADINIQNMAVVKFGEFIRTIPFPSSINIFKMEPLKGYSLLVLEAPLVFACVELFFGSKSPRNVKSEGRSFTAIEQRVIRKMVSLALTDMEASWSGIAPIRTEHVSSEINPQFVTIVTPSEIVIKIEVAIEIENFTGKMYFCIPYSMVEPVKEKLYSGIQGEKFDMDQRWVNRLRDILLGSAVEVVARIGAIDMTCEDLMHLNVGDVLTLNRSATDELPVYVESVHKFAGTPGFSRGSQALKITKVMT